MTTIVDLYPLLEKMGLSKEETVKFISVFEEERKKGLATHEDLIEFRAEVRSELRTIKWMLGVNIAAIIGIILLILRLG